MHSTKQRLIDTGLGMLLEQGYNSLGIQALLTATGTPKGSFYHHFKDKEDFALKAARAGTAFFRADTAEIPGGRLHGLPHGWARTRAVGR